MIIKSKKDLYYANENFLDLKYKLLNKISSAESHFEKLLKNENIYYVREKCNFKKNTLWCYYDFYIPRLRLYIEIDGKEHLNKENKIKDIKKESYINKKHCYLIRFTNEEVLTMEKISTNFILNKLYDKISKDKYYMSIRYFRKTQKEEIDTNFKNILYNGNIFLYSHFTGMYYEFKDIYKCVAYTGLKTKFILNLLKLEYTKQPTRIYVTGRTLKECESNVSTVFD